MELKYSQKIEDMGMLAHAMGTRLNISPKHAIVICDKLRGMKVNDAISLLESVIALEKSIPFKKFNTGVGHRPGSHNHEFKIGKYPRKAAFEFLKVLKNLEGNGEFKELDTENLKIIHISSQKGRSMKKIAPKGRWKRWTTQYINIQVIAEEVMI
ncbi:MAG: 50S ribosomal protein L22 [Candidatus Altiarchaeales archaeon HGW-Altiarchaeales-3]|nr:MAG: 50S ribosomal protein L22 [Candidatus Altiarchaeales archaeon HGW-Altiarchaeales-3]